MRKSLTIALLHLKTTFKSRGALLTMFGMPLMLTLIFGVLTQGGGNQANAKGRIYPVAIVDLDGSFASRQLTEMLKNEANLSVRMTTATEMDKLFADQKIVAGVVIPAKFQEELTARRQPEVKLVSAPGKTDYLGFSPIVRRQVPRLAQDFRMALELTQGKGDAAQVEAAFQQVAAKRKLTATTVTTTQVTRSTKTTQVNVDAASGASVGFTVTFVMMQVFMMSGVILTERKQGTWGRLLTTPNGRTTIMTGYLLSFLLTGMLQFSILVGATTLFFHVAWGPWLPLFAMGGGTVLSAAGMGLFLAGLVKTFDQQMSIGILIINASAMLGGAYWDLSMVSETMRRIGYLTPQAWAMDGFKEVMLRGGSWSGIALPLTVLLGISLVFLTAGLLRVRYE